MAKIYPNAAGGSAAAGTVVGSSLSEMPDGNNNTVSVLTVWKKSLLFNCDGFTVFDSKGNLVFRVDNYMSGPSKGEIVLMDASGNSLLTIRRKRLCLGDHWLVFEGEQADNPRYSVRKHVNLLNTRSLARVISLINANGSRKNHVVYEIEGSYTRRCCVVYDDKRKRVAEIKRKEPMGGLAFGLDVFRLIVYEPDIDSAVAMSFVILLDQMFRSSTSARFSFSTTI